MIATILNKRILASLTAAALATPGLALAESPATKPMIKGLNEETSAKLNPSWYNGIQSDFRFTHYAEDGPRYNIDVWQAHFVVPVDKWKFTLDLQRDSQTGGSQDVVTQNWVFFRTPPFEVIGNRSGASIIESGNELSFKTAYTAEDAEYEVQAYYWDEHDLIAPAISAVGKWDFNKRNSRIIAGAGVTYFNSKPALYTNVSALKRQKGDYWIQSYYAAFKQDLSKYNFIQISNEFQYQQGELRDPYKQAAITGNATFLAPPGQTFFLPPGQVPPLFPDGITILMDKRPKHRSIWMPMLRFVQYVPGADGSLHFDYRFGTDSWDITSHAFELKYFQPFWEKWQFAPLVRYYSQSSADFYGAVYNIGPGTPVVPGVTVPPFTPKGWTSDYRLSAYGTINLEARLSYQPYHILNVGFTAGYYKLRPAWTMSKQNVNVNPALPKKGVGAHYFSADLRIKL